MLPKNEQEATQRNLELFWKGTDQAYDSARQMVHRRSATRDVGMPPWEKMPYGEMSYTTFIFHKSARLVSMVQMSTQDEQSEQEHQSKIDDELLDIINYAAMMWAYRRLKEAHQ